MASLTNSKSTVGVGVGMDRWVIYCLSFARLFNILCIVCVCLSSGADLDCISQKKVALEPRGGHNNLFGYLVSSHCAQRESAFLLIKYCAQHVQRILYEL